MNTIDLSIIIVNYNTKEFLRNCLKSIKNNVSSKLSYEVIVVDNASSDGTKDEMTNDKIKITNFIYIQNKENVGFSKANNIGVKHANGSYILFLNADTIIYPNTLEYMVTFMDKNKSVGAATCFLELENKTLDDASHRGFPTPWNAFCHFSGIAKIFSKSKLFGGYNMGWLDIKKTHEIDALAGAFMFVRREAGEDVDWWDEEYFFYGEDLDFCYKLKEKGWKIYFVSEVKTLHYKGVSGGIKKHSQTISTADKDTKLRATKARFDAMKIFYKKHYRDKYPAFISKMVFLGIDLKYKLAKSKV